MNYEVGTLFEYDDLTYEIVNSTSSIDYVLLDSPKNIRKYINDGGFNCGNFKNKVFLFYLQRGIIVPVKKRYLLLEKFYRTKSLKKIKK